MYFTKDLIFSTNPPNPFPHTRCKGPISYSFNGCYNFNSHLISSSHSCCYVCCSSSNVYTNPINPKFLCGTRQSSLIHFSVSRRLLVLPGPDPYCFRTPVQESCRKCRCGDAKERGFNEEMGRDLGERKFGRIASVRRSCDSYGKKGRNLGEKKSRRMASEGRSCDFETAEMMLSLLIEDVGNECYGVRERDYRSSRRVGYEKKGDESDICFRKEKKEKENKGSGLLRSNSRSKYEGLRIGSRDNEARSIQKEDRMSEDEEVVRSEKLRRGKSGSSSSSYYTCPSRGEEYESDSEIHVKESGDSYQRDPRESRNVAYEEERKENLRRNGSVVGSHKVIDSDWRKKSEKKLDEVANEEVCEASHRRSSSSHKQFDDFDNKAKSFTSESARRHQYSQKNDQVARRFESRNKQKHFVDMSENDEKSTLPGSYIHGKTHEHVKLDDRVRRRDDYRLSTEQSNQGSKTEDVNLERTNNSQSQYGDRVKRQQDRFSVVPSPVQNIEKRHDLKSEEDPGYRVSRRDDYILSTKQSNRGSEIEDLDLKRTDNSQSRYGDRVKRQEDRITLVPSLDIERRHYLKSEEDPGYRVSRRDDYRLSPEQSDQGSKFEDLNLKRTNNSQSQYGDSVKRQEDRFSVVPSPVQDIDKRYYLKSEDPRQIDSRRKFPQSAEISDDHARRRGDYKSSTEQANQFPQIEDMNVRTNISQAQYNDKRKRREDQSLIISSSGQDTKKHFYLKNEDDLRRMDSRGEYRQSGEISDDQVSGRGDYKLSTESSDNSQIQNTTAGRTNKSHAQYEDKVKRHENQPLVVSGSEQDTEYQYYLQAEDDLRHMDSRRKLQHSSQISGDRVSQRDDQVSQTEPTNVKGTNVTNAQYDDKKKRQDVRSSVMSTSTQDRENRYDSQKEEELRRMDSKRKLQRSTEISAAQAQETHSGQQAIGKTESTEVSLNNSTIMLGQSSDAQVTNIHKTSENKICSPEKNASMVPKPKDDSRKRAETSDNRILPIGHIRETGGASSLQTSLVSETKPTMEDQSNSQAIVMSSKSRIGLDSDALRTYDVHLTSISDEDALGSAHRFQQSSSKIVGEFLEEVTHETSKEKMLPKGHKQEQKSSSEQGDIDLKPKYQDSRRSSGSSGVKGPSDEIWDEVAPSTQRSTDIQIQAPERTSPNQNIVVKRTGRSLWNVFSDIVMLRWSSQSKTLSPKSGVRNSPNQSTTSETWFSGDENIKKRNKSMSHESIPTPTQSQGEGYSSSSSKDKISPSKTPIGSTTLEEDTKMGTSTMMETSVSMPSLRNRKSPKVDDVAESDKRTTISASSSLTGKELATVSSPMNMKRKMLQRATQVGKDRFDEWEEAFTLETEQRKIDEGFMREALLEAKKAGDMWEVPVGAVLVQHGKIISRGYNLVEELRDSTAHAEMICIREASKQLRTWRLVDATLYVTLEPCPMCAGAILQARVDTVVWGAPNKLLGADGSWIRLFPGGYEGGASSEPTDKPPAPVHPFHPKIEIRRGVLGTECADIMQQFFQLRRRTKDKKQLPETSSSPPSCLPIANQPTKIFNKVRHTFHIMFCL